MQDIYNACKHLCQQRGYYDRSGFVPDMLLKLGCKLHRHIPFANTPLAKEEVKNIMNEFQRFCCGFMDCLEQTDDAELRKHQPW